MTDADIPEWVAEYIGIPHLPAGTTKDGLDCWGLLRLAYNAHSGRVLPPYSGPAWRSRREPYKPIGEAATGYSEQFQPVPPGEERLFDGILLRMQGVPIHCGMVVSPGWMLHVQQGADATVERYRPSLTWENRIVGFYRHV